MHIESAPTVPRLMSFVWGDGALPHLRAIDGAALPAAAAALLRHEEGMTATLERHWGEPMTLTVLRAERIGESVHRAVVLSGRNSARPAELGLIEIALANLPQALASEVEEGRVPFGALLARAGIRFRSRPHRFFAMRADAVLAQALSVPLGVELFGRETRLTDEAGHLLAEAVEIVAPLPR